MLDGVLADLTNRRSDEAQATVTLPWQGVALLLCLVIGAVVAAVVYPAVFAAPLQQF